MAETKKREADSEFERLPKKKIKFEKNSNGKSAANKPFKKQGKRLTVTRKKNEWEWKFGSTFWNYSATNGDQQNGKKFVNKFSKKPAEAGQNKFAKKDEENKGQTSEKTDWHKLKQDKKDLKLKRKSKDNELFELTAKAKQIYEKLKW